MSESNLFFGFGEFEHCQDSFLGWLFNGYQSNDPCARVFAERLAGLFCDMNESTQIVSWHFDAESQKTFWFGKKKSIIDVVIRIIADNEIHEVYIEDKTRPDFKMSQMNDMKRAVESHVSEENRLVKRHFVYLNTANMSDFVMTERGIDAFASKQKKEHEYVVVLRDDVLRLLDDIHIPPVENKNESILRQYVAYLRDSSRGYDGIESIRSESVFEMVNDILEAGKLSDSIGVSIRFNDYGSPGGKKHFHRIYIWNKTVDRTIRLLLCLQPKSKSHSKLFLAGYEADPKRFSKIYDYVSLKLGAKETRRMTEDSKMLGDKKTFVSIDELGSFLETSIFAYAEATALK